jgi:predicted restriction endonuclease
MLGVILKRAAELGIAVPDTPERKYEEKITAFLAEHPEERGTETERVTRQRIGQDLYREALLEYWGFTCAVTGIDIQEVLRASHAKLWADCTKDSERLNVYNGFLLSANYDALFDTGLITFNNSGTIAYSPQLSSVQISYLGLEKYKGLRWIDERHFSFLEWHREKVFRK